MEFKGCEQTRWKLKLKCEIEKTFLQVVYCGILLVVVKSVHPLFTKDLQSRSVL